MVITVDISMYPLDRQYGTHIIRFIHELRACAGIEVVTNQMSTQLSGEFEAVMAALRASMRGVMEADRQVVFVAKYVNLDLDIGTAPAIG